MTNICITGAAGLLGQYLVNTLKTDHDILAVDIAPNPFPENPNINYLQADLTDFASIRGKLLEYKPYLLFNCAAFNDVDRCETQKEMADKLNFELVNHLISVSPKKIIHYSSDYIFDGQSGPYDETAAAYPINYYGITKLHSENILIHSKIDYLIIRTNVLYGKAISTRTNFVTWVIESLRGGETIKVVDDQFNNPTYAPNLAAASAEAAVKNIQGILHIAGDDYLSRYEAAIRIAKIFSLPTGLIQRVKTSEIPQQARRPRSGGLKTDMARKVLTTRLMGLDEGLKSLRESGY